MDISRLNNDQLLAIGTRLYERIVRQMNEGGGTKFGVDWPTTCVVYPRETAVFQRVKNEWKRRHGKA